MNRRLAVAVTVLLAAGSLSGCSAQAKVATVPAKPAVTKSASQPVQDVPVPVADPTQQDAALKKAVTDYSDAFLSGRAKQSYALLSSRCITRTPWGQFSYGVSQAKILYGNPLPIRTYAATVAGDMARVTYTYDTSGINQTDQPWVREHGQWHYDAC